jgi:type VI secretion system protein ImpM
MSGLVLSAIEPESPAGLYGKLPDKGDFISRRLPRGFVEPWDAWLQQGIEKSREQLGADWLEAYLKAPLWRFGLVPGVCGKDGVTGVVMSSADRVGRHFPLTLAALLPRHARPAQIFSRCRAWFDSAEFLLLEALAQPFDFEAFDRQVCQLGSPDRSEQPDNPIETTGIIRIPPAMREDFAAFCPMLVDTVLAEIRPEYSLWWTVGSQWAAGSFLICQGLPSAGDFTALLTREVVFGRHQTGA